jgi:hypothetical protein
MMKNHENKNSGATNFNREGQRTPFWQTVKVAVKFIVPTFTN